MVSWSLVCWLFVIFSVRVHLHIREIRSELFCHQFTCLQVCSSLSLKIYSVSYLQSYSLTQGVWIKIWILALFFNQRYESGPKAVIPTCSQVVSIILSGELSNSSDTLLLYSAEGTKIAFQVCLLLEHVGGPKKDQIFVAGQEISKFSLCIFFLLIVCLLA